MIDAEGVSESTITSWGSCRPGWGHVATERGLLTTPAHSTRTGTGWYGEGAAVLVWKRSTQSAGGQEFTRAGGVWLDGDAFHVTAPHETGAGGTAAIQQALAAAKANPEDVG
jgi:3-oxoacyl-(acyl-carrier-protein) synthase